MDQAEKTFTQESPQETQVQKNADSLSQEINWFARVVNSRLRVYFPAETNSEENKSLPQEEKNHWWGKILPSKESPLLLPEKSELLIEQETTAPDLSGDNSVYAEFVKHYKLTADERLILMLVLLPHVQPHLLDVFFSINKAISRGYTEFGGIKSNRHSGFLPTIETALFLIAGNDLGKRFSAYKYFEPDHIFTAHNILSLDQGVGGELFYNSSILLTDEYVDFFTTGNFRKPSFSMEFPAKRLTTKMDWDDLVVDEFTAQQLDELRIWLQYGRTLYDDWGMGRKLKPGYKALFYGPPRHRQNIYRFTAR